MLDLRSPFEFRNFRVLRHIDLKLDFGVGSAHPIQLVAARSVPANEIVFQNLNTIHFVSR